MDVFDFRAPEPFLRAAFDGLKAQQGQRSSLRALSRRFGISSVATLSMVLSGKRKVTPEVAEKLISILKLKGARRRYFLALVDLTHTADAEGRLALEEDLLFLRKMGGGALRREQYDFLSQWYYVPLFVMVGLSDFRRDNEWLAKRLGNGLTLKQVAEVLSNMLKLGILRDEGGKLSQHEGPIVKTEEDVANLCVRKFHGKMLDFAKSALDSPVQDREITGLTFAIAKKHLPALKEKIRQFREEMDQYAASLGGEDEVYQLNLQLFPVTKRVEKKQ